MANVLLVVNDIQAGYDLRAILRSAGHAVLLEFDSREALAAVDREDIVDAEDIDVVACDAVLPGMFGTDLIVALRMTLQRPDLPAILLSELPDELSYELFDAEPVQVLTASCSGEQLLTLIGELGLGGSAAQHRRTVNDRSSAPRRRMSQQRSHGGAKTPRIRGNG